MRGPEACSCGAGDVVIGLHTPQCDIFKEPERCACGHPFVDHTDFLGCTGGHASRYWFCACPGYAEAPSPLSEDGAVSAIADHSTGSGPDALEGRRRGSPSTPKGATEAPAIPAADAGRGTDSTEPRRTLHGPTVEAAGDAHQSYDRRRGLRPPERKLVIALAEARLAMTYSHDPDDYDRYIRAADAIADLFPVLTCPGCGDEFVQGDARKTMWCSERCRYRVGQRRRRARLKAEAAQAAAVWCPCLPPGGWVCERCGQPVESEPCAEHMDPEGVMVYRPGVPCPDRDFTTKRVQK